ncbi:MAG: type IV pilus modification PilV family protein, partial [Minisyncoccia bacterium]
MKFNRQGQILVEAIIALSVLTVGFLSLIGLLSNSIGLSKVVNENYIATYLAGEGIEIVRNIIDTNRLTSGNAWNQGINDGFYEVEYNSVSLNPNQDRFLKFNNINNVYNYQSGVDTPFKRKIEIQNSTDRIKIISTVSWTSRGGAQNEIQLEDYVYNSLLDLSRSPSPSPTPTPTPSPSPTTTIDVLSFFLRRESSFIPYSTSSLKYSPIELKENPGEPVRGELQFDQFIKGNDIYLEKYRDPTQIVHYFYDSNYIYLKEDNTANFPYAFTDGRWAKRYMNIGETIDVSSNQVIEYSTSTCSTSSKPWPYKITLSNYDSSYNAG